MTRQGSEPDEADSVFLESVMTLEIAPSSSSISQGNSGRVGLFRSSSLAAVQRIELRNIPRRSWDMVLRGAVSEWFPAMPESSEDQECLGLSGGD